MASSEDYMRGLVNRQGGDWGAAVRGVIGTMTPAGAAKHLAKLTGKSVRTAERWIAKATNKINPKTGRPSQASEPKPMEQVNIVEDMKRRAAAQKMRQAQRVKAGRVRVVYAGAADQGSRNVGDLPAVGVLGDAIEVAADLVEQGDYAAAAEALDAGVLDAYGVPEGTLEIDSYENGFSLE